MELKDEKAEAQQTGESKPGTFVEIVHASTADGLRLDASLQVPAPGRRHPHLDAIMCVHGAYGNFYGSIMTGLFPRLLNLGMAVLRVNLRSHDIISRSPALDGERVVGSVYEIVDDCRHDIAAWIGFLAGRGMKRVALLGHCLGAVKVIYAQAHSQHEEVKAVAALSTSLFSHARARESSGGAEFIRNYETALRHVENGNELALMEVASPFKLMLSARSFLDHFGPDERYNVLRFGHLIRCPIIFVFGEAELANMFMMEGLAGRIAALPDAGGRRKIKIVPGANHLYKGKEIRLVLENELEAWLTDERNWVA